MALLVRKDMQSTLEDPISVLLPGVCVNHENLQSAHTLQQHIQQQTTAIKSPSRAGSPSAVSRRLYFIYYILTIFPK